VELRFRPADLNRVRLLGRFSVTFGGSIAGQPWEIRVGMGEDRIRDREQPDGHQTRQVPLDHGRVGFAQERSCRSTEYLQATTAVLRALREQAPIDSGSPRRVQIPVRESKAMGNFWDSLNAEQRVAFRAKAHKRVFAAGARLMQEGEHGDHVAVILSGLTEIRVCENGTERVVAVRGPGQLIGERAALEVNPRSATVVALQTVVALVMRTADFAAFVSTYPAVLKIVEEQIFTRLRESRADQELTDGQQAPARTGSRHVGAGSTQLTGQNCTIVRTDIVEYGAFERNAEAHKIIKKALLAMTQLALGSAWETCRCEDRGDGLLVIVSPEVPTAQVIERLVSVLPHQLKRHNVTYSAASRIQLRLAVEVGPIEDTEVGVTGRSIIGVSRMLEAHAFKRAITVQGAILGVIVSPYVYETHIKPDGSFLDPADFIEIPVRVKEAQTSAWMQLIGRAVPLPRQPLMAAQDGHVQLATSGRSSPCSRV
jgi:CRP-like cAMP-binding protein